MPLFLDTSALLKLYVQEDGSDCMRTIIDRPDLRGGFFISDCVVLEMHGGLAKMLRQGTEERQRAGRDENNRNRRWFEVATAEFLRDASAAFGRVDVDAGLISDAVAFARSYADRRITPMDLIHLASVFRLSNELRLEGLEHDVTLVLSDRPFQSIAQGVGVSTFDPTLDDPATISAPELPL